MSETTTSARVDGDQPFPSVEALRAEHRELLRRHRDGAAVPDVATDIQRFLRRGQATGKALDEERDRRDVQSILDYWTTSLVRDGRPVIDDTVLDEFDPKTILQVIESVNNWLAQPSEIDRAGLARSIMLRLVRLNADDTFVMRTAVQDVCEALEPRRDAEQVLKDLVRLGAVRLSRNAADSEEVALRSSELMTQWPRFQEWLRKRLEFRQRANGWAKRRDAKATADPAMRPPLRRAADAFRVWALKAGEWISSKWRALQHLLKRQRPSVESISSEEYKAAATYRDRNQAELHWTYEKRELEKERAEWKQIRTFVGVVVGVVFLGLAIVVVILAINGARQATAAAEALLKKAEADRQVLLTSAALETARADFAAAKARAETERIKAESDGARIQEVIDIAKESMGRSPQKSLLMSVEAARASKSLIDRLGAKQKSEILNTLNNNAEDSLRKTLRNMGGLGYYADIGAIVHLAAFEQTPTDAENSALRWLAAAGSKGLIALWDFANPNEPKQAILRFGYEPQIGRLIITGDGAYLIALNNQNVSVWDLRTSDPKPYFFELRLTGVPVTSSKGTWLAGEDSNSKGKFIYLGMSEKEPKVIPWDLNPHKGRHHWRALRFAFFSKDERWFSWITDKGDALIWDLKALAASAESAKYLPTLLQGKSGSRIPKSGAFLDDGTGVVAFLSDGWARYWASKDDQWSGLEPVNDVDLMKSAGLDRETINKDKKQSPLFVTTKRGTHAVMTVRAGATQTPETYCFTLQDVASSLGKGKKVRRYEDKAPMGALESDESGRYLIASYFSYSGADRQVFRIWDLASADKEGNVAEPQEVPFPEQYHDVKPVPRFPSVVLRGNQNFVQWLNLSSSQPETLLLRGHDGIVKAHAYSQEGRWLVTGCEHGTIRAWKLNPLSSSADPVIVRTAVAQNIALTSRMLAVSLPDSAMRFLPVKNGGFVDQAIRFPIDKELNEAGRLYPSDDGQWLLEHHSRSEIGIVWNLGDGIPKAVARLSLPGFQVNDPLGSISKQPCRLQASDKGKWLAINGKPNSSTLLWNLTSISKEATAKVMKEIPGDLVGFDALGMRILVTDKAVLRTWRLEAQQWVLDPHEVANVYEAAVSPDKTRCMVFIDANEGMQVELRDIGMEPARVQKLAGNSKGDVLFLSEDGKLAWTRRGPDSELRYWDLTSSNRGRVQPAEFRATPGNDLWKARLVKESRDLRWLVTQENGEGFLWKLQGTVDKGKLKPFHPLARVNSAVFSADSSSVVTSGDGKIRAYRLEDSVREACEVPGWGLEFEVVGAALSAKDAKPVLAVVCKVNNDLLLRVWNLEEKQGPKLILADSILVRPTEMWFRHDGGRLYLFSDKMIRVIELNIGELLEKKAKATVGRNLRPQEWPTNVLKDFRTTFSDLPVPAGVAPAKLFIGRIEGKSGKWSEIFDKQDKLPKIAGAKEKPFKEYEQDMEAGVTYLVEMRSRELDSYLILRDPNGNERARDDDGGGFPDALIRYKCEVAGKYKIVATSFDGEGGSFRLKVSKAPRIESRALPLDLRGLAKQSIQDHKLSEDDAETGDGPGVTYDLLVPPGKICQVEVNSSSFEPTLRIERGNDDGLRSAVGTGGRAQLVFNTRMGAGQEHTTYRIIVIGTRGKAGTFDLNVEIR